MDRSKYLNRHQYKFFRTLAEHPDGLPRHLWPTPLVLKRWLQQPPFVERLRHQALPGLVAEFVARRSTQLKAMQQLSASLAVGDMEAVALTLNALRAGQGGGRRGDDRPSSLEELVARAKAS